MSALTMVALDPVTAGGSSLGEATRGAEGIKQRAAAFENALGRQTAAAQPPVQVAQAQFTQVQVAQAQGVQAQGVPAPSAPSGAVQPAERARRALELDRVQDTAKPAGGDLILDGIQKLRGTFDSRHARVAEIANRGVVDASALLAMQVEVVNYTLTVDVTSKLTGKSTQSFDTLMKGQ